MWLAEGAHDCKHGTAMWLVIPMVRSFMNTAQRSWFRNLIGGCISAMAGAGSGFLGMNGAHGLGADVPLLNWKALGVLLATTGMTSVFLYLKQSPLPPTDATTTITETTTRDLSTPKVEVQTRVTETKVETAKDVKQ